jgi:RHS repeat-associated protein
MLFHKKYILVVFILFCSSILLAQAISGPVFITLGQTTSYTYTTSSSIGNPRWTTAKQGATIVSTSQSGSTYSVTIAWNDVIAGADQVIFLNGSTLVSQLDVFINCTSAPANPAVTFTTSTNLCGDKTISYTGTPPSGIAWYWLTSPDKVATDNGTNTYTATTSGTYYVRAKRTTANCWSTGYAQVTVTVNKIPSTPAAFTVSTNTCDAKTLTRSGGVAGVSWFWQGTDSQGTSTVNAGLTYDATASGVYYLRAQSSAGCWSNNSASANVTVTNTPAAPTTATDAVAFKNSVASISVGPVTGTTSYRWYGPSGIISGVSTASYQPSLNATTTFQVSAVNGTCESAAKKDVTVTVLNDPQVSVQNNMPAVVALRKPITLVVTEGYTTYTWKQNNIVVGSGATLNVSEPGSYVVVVTRNGVYGEGISAPLQVSGGADEQDLNYIIRNIPQEPSVTNVAQVQNLSADALSQSVEYFDGLGRPVQSVTTQGSPSKNDLIKPVQYDAFGRETFGYLPYASTEGSGWYKSNAVNTASYSQSSHSAFYSNGTVDKVIDDTKPFAETIFEPSPLNRVVKAYQPGSAWAASTPDNPNGKDKYIQYDYLVNSYGTGVSATDEKIIAWQIDANGMPVRYAASNGVIEAGGYYSTGKLYVKVTVDENGHAVREYTNKKGQVVLKKVQAGSAFTNLNSTADWALTYYIYDRLDNLRYVFPPELSKQIHSNADTYVVTSTDLANWAFQYKYDGRKRMVEKRVPGAEAVYMVYDNRDRLVLTQDGNQRANNLWTFTKYDELNRPIATGIKDTTAGLTLAEMQLGIDNHYAKSWAKYGEAYIGAADKNVHGYSNLSYPTVTTAKVIDWNRYLTVTYYDNYTFKNLFGSDYNYINDALSETVNGYLYEQRSSEFTSVIGQVTGAKVKVLDGGVAGGYTWLKSVSYYDDKYRVIQTISDNYKGGTDRTSMLYDFVGKTLQTKSLHTESDILWTDLVTSYFSGNILKSTSTSGTWGLSGAASVQSLAAGQDGWIEFMATEANTYRMIGLSSQNTNAHYNAIGYAIYLKNNGTVAVYESGSPKKDVGSYSPGDIFRIQRIGTAIKYFRNGQEIYPAGETVTQALSNSALLVDVGFNALASVAGVRASFANSSHTITRRFVYDHAGRLQKTYHGIDAPPNVLLASNEYNELGQLVDKGLHSVNGSTPMQSVDYRYNIRGWLTSMNNSQLTSDGLTNDDAGDFFGMNLAYNEELGTGNAQSTFTNTGLVSSYTFDGNASDAAVNGLNGTVYGAQLTTDSQGNSNSAYNFTASDYIDIPNSKDRHSFIQNTGIFTISAFVKIDDLNGRNVIVSSTGTSASKGFTLMYETYGSGYGDHQLRFSTTYGQSGSVFIALGGVRTINDNNWHHVAAVGDGEYVTLYVDGVQDGSPTRMTTFSTGSATSTTLIGKTRSSATVLSLGMVGAIDELNILNRPLSKSEIGALATRTPFNTTLDDGQYNGNISAMKWSINQGMGETKEMAYNFKYDVLNRLVSADNLQSSSLGVWSNGKYHERDLTYDLNGNIKSLTRSSEPGMIDNLVYNYGTGTTYSNKLLSVTDKTTDAIAKLNGFKDSNTSGNDYTYDVNGNMTVDLNKGLSTPITYNYLNLPEVVTKSVNNIRYIYDATGRKLSQIVRTGLAVNQTDYAGEFIYENDFLRFVNHEEGRIVVSSEKLLYKHDGDVIEGLTALNTTLTPMTINGEKYISASSGGSGSGIFPIGNAINVVPGEKYLIRVKGYRSDYNVAIMVRRNNSTITYGSYLPALVANESWIEQIYVVPANTTTMEVGIGWNSPTGTAHLFLNAFELIKLESTTPEYQYNLKDHLGNVRLTFTTKQDIESNTATLEDENAEEEQGKFLRYDNTRIVNHFLFDHTKGSKPTQVEGGAQRLSGQGNEIYGLAKSLSVMPGDVINMEVYAKYIDPNESNRTAALNTLIMQIAAGTAPGGTVIDGGSYAASTSSFPFPADATQNTSSSSEASPKAFLSWLVYDRNYTLIASKSGFRQMSSVAKEDGSDVAHELLSGTVTITEPGYIYVFLSNEQGTNPYEVYFDDFMVEQVKSPVIQTQDYYPFGLTFNSYQRENSVDQRHLYNGKEQQNELGIDWLDYGARMYMPELGRWGVIDPHSYKYSSVSPYNYAFNNPITIVDPDGKDGVIYLQVLLNRKNIPAIDIKTLKLIVNKITLMLKEAGIDLRVEVHYSNRVMSKKEFYSREGAHKSDSYLLLGSNEQLVKAAKQATSKEGGWDERVSRTTYENENGVHSYDDHFGLLNSDNLAQNGIGKDGRMERYAGMVDKASKIAVHEDGHSKLNGHPSADKEGHVINTIMDENPGSVVNPKHDKWMIERLKKIHGSIPVSK